MSTIYVSEPPTKGKVIVNTTYGPVDIELWPKEAPKAVRNFVQLCLEGYYDDTIFHRVIKGFLVQAGDPTGSGTGGESIYGDAFGDEFHSRLRFNHRGIVACANAGTPHSNGSQFFISLDKCDWLDKKNTIFGKVTGDSIYNLLELGKVETDKDDRPLDPIPRIKSVEVLWNPFEDIVPRAPLKPLIIEADKKQPKQKVVKKLNLLSFGEEAEQEEKELAAVKQKIKSSHDVLNDPRLLKEQDNPSDAKVAKDVQLAVRGALSSKKGSAFRDSEAESAESSDGDDDDENEARFDARMKRRILEKQKKLGDIPSKRSENGSSSKKDRRSSAPRPDAESDHDEKPRVEKLSLKKKGIGSEARAERMAKADTDMQLYGEAERGRLLQKQKRRRLQGREDDVLARVQNFTKALQQKPTTSSNKSTVVETEDISETEDLSDWTTAILKFTPEHGKDDMSRKEKLDDYVVHDPLLEKGREKFNRMQAKQKKRGREWAGKSLT